MDENMAQFYGATQPDPDLGRLVWITVTHEARRHEYEYCSLSCVCAYCLRRDEYIAHAGERRFLNEIATPAPLRAP